MLATVTQTMPATWARPSRCRRARSPTSAESAGSALMRVPNERAVIRRSDAVSSAYGSRGTRTARPAHMCEYMTRPGTSSLAARIEPVSDSVMNRVFRSGPP